MAVATKAAIKSAAKKAASKKTTVKKATKQAIKKTIATASKGYPKDNDAQQVQKIKTNINPDGSWPFPYS